MIIAHLITEKRFTYEAFFIFCSSHYVTNHIRTMINPKMRHYWNDLIVPARIVCDMVSINSGNYSLTEGTTVFSYIGSSIRINGLTISPYFRDNVHLSLNTLFSYIQRALLKGGGRQNVTSQLYLPPKHTSSQHTHTHKLFTKSLDRNIVG